MGEEGRRCNKEANMDGRGFRRVSGTEKVSYRMLVSYIRVKLV